MLPCAWLVLQYLVIPSALVLTGTIIATCLRSSPAEPSGFVIRTDCRVCRINRNGGTLP